MSTTTHSVVRSGGTQVPPPDLTAAPWVAVSGSAQRGERERPVNPRRMVVQVLAGVAVVLILVAVSGSIAARRLSEKESVNDFAKVTNVVAEAVVQPALTDGLAEGDPAAVAAMDRVVRARVIGTASVRVKIWTPDGTIVYSDEPELIGQKFPLGSDQRAVFGTPQLRAEISDVDEPENQFERGQGKLLEVYRPVWTPNGSPLLFESYAPYDEVTSRATQLWRGFAGITLTSLVALIVLLTPVLWRLLDNARTGRTQREQLLQRAVDASTDERRRIAGSLHDGVVQELAATSFAVSSAAQRAEAAGEPELASDLRKSAGTVRTTIGGLRSLLVDIYPPSLAHAGLTAALEDLAASLRLREVEVVLEVDSRAVDGLDEATSRLIYRVAQECLLNTTRHARARTAWMLVEYDGRCVVLEVSDDGQGFDAQAVLEDPAEGHFGLRVLGDVADDSGAELWVVSVPGRGTCWQLKVPVR